MRFFLAITLLLIASGPRTPAAQTAADVAPFLYTVVKVFDPLAWLHGADRFPGGAQIYLSNESETIRPSLII